MKKNPKAKPAGLTEVLLAFAAAQRQIMLGLTSMAFDVAPHYVRRGRRRATRKATGARA